MLILFCLFRIGFISVLQQYLNGATTWNEIIAALYYGARMSLKSAGAISLPAFLFCTLPSVIFINFNFNKFRFYIGTLFISILSVLFNARIPFYQDFHVAFNQLIFNIFKDDIAALGYTLVQQYHLFSRLFLSLLMALLFSWVLKQVLSTRNYAFPRFSQWYNNLGLRVGLTLTIILFMIFARFGGSLTYANSIHWENSAISRDEFLNEAILDDVQALYRAYMTHVRLQTGQGFIIETGKIGEYASHLAGRKLDSHSLDDFLKKEAQGAKIKKPRHIFIIVGESYANWPLLSKYENLNIANGLKGIMVQKNSASVSAFIPNGTGTMEAMNGLITGLAEVNLSPNYQPEAYKTPYSTAFAPQMKRLGYKTNLWYGGFSSWQRLKEFALAQGFDNFFASNDFADQSGNAWGTEDRNLFDGISTLFKDDEPSVNIVLTTSNHPPYTVNIEQEGFDASHTIDGLPDNLKTDKETMSKLGHFWYADKSITEFVQRMYKQYPESIFIITGDHADRFNIETNPSMYERYVIPCVFYGNGIQRQILPPNAAGGQLNIMPTLIELIAPRGFVYYSVVESMTKPSKLGINRDFWIESDNIGKNSFAVSETITGEKTAQSEYDSSRVKQDIDAVQGISWWMVKNGKNIK